MVCCVNVHVCTCTYPYSIPPIPAHLVAIFGSRIVQDTFFLLHSLSRHLLLSHALPHKVEGWLEQLSALGGELLQSGPELCGQVLQAGPRWPVFISDFKPGDQDGGGFAERLHASIGDNLSTYGGACMCMWLGALHVCCMCVACLCMFGSFEF